MGFAEGVGWGRYLPPLIVSNDDLSEFVDTSDEWIFSRTGIRQRHYSHVSTGKMAWLAGERALAAAGRTAQDLDLVLLGTTTSEDLCPSTASYIKNELGADHAAAFDLNAACTSWFYGLTIATDMIRAGTIERALVMGAERLSLAMDWNKRESCCLFGDGAGAVVLERSDQESGLMAAQMGCIPTTREALKIPRWGIQPQLHRNELYLSLDFDGSTIFKRAVTAMAMDCEKALANAGLTIEDIDLFVPHQANIRIIEAMSRKLDFPMEKVVVCVDQCANTSAASIPIALCEALERGRVKAGMRILVATFGAGLSHGAGVIHWGSKTTVTKRSDALIPEYHGDLRTLMADSFAYHGILLKDKIR